MTRKEAERLNRLFDALRLNGIAPDHAEALRRISLTLRRWFEMECATENGMIERSHLSQSIQCHPSYCMGLFFKPGMASGIKIVLVQ